MEVALAKQDDIIHLLLALGAKCNLPTQTALTRSWGSDHRMTLKDWVASAIKDLDEELSQQKQSSTKIADEVVVKQPNLTCDTWKSYISQLRDSLAALNARVKSSERDETRFQEALSHKAFLEEVLAVFEAKGAKTWSELYPDIPVGEKSNYRYVRDDDKDQTAAERGYLRNNGLDQAPKHLWPLYDQLFEACWTGDDERIKQLCLPEFVSASTVGATEKPELLQITVVAPTSGDRWCKFPAVTPLICMCSIRTLCSIVGIQPP